MEKVYKELRFFNLSPDLSFPDFDSPFKGETDASSVAVRGISSQEKESGKMHTIQFICSILNMAELEDSVCEREALVVLFSLRKFRVYVLSSQQFKNDNQSSSTWRGVQEGRHTWTPCQIIRIFGGVWVWDILRLLEQEMSFRFLSRYCVDPSRSSEEGDFVSDVQMTAFFKYIEEKFASYWTAPCGSSFDILRPSCWK